MIVIEGPDNSGKTTLGEDLCRRMEIEYNHSMGPFQTREALMINMARITKMERTKNVFVQDRYPLISEQVYQPIIRPDNKIMFAPEDGEAHEVIWWNEHRMEDFFIVCLPPRAIVVETIQKSQPKVIRDNIGKIYDSYNILVNNVWNRDRELPEVVNLFVYDYTKHWQHSALLRCLIQWIRMDT